MSNAPPHQPAAALGSPPRSRPGGFALSTIFWFTLLLAILMITAKGKTVSHAFWGFRDVLAYAADLAVISHQDLAVAIAMGLLGWLCLLPAGRFPRSSKVACIVWMALCAVFAIYSIASALIYQATRIYLNYPLLCLASDFGDMRSSITIYATPWALRCLIGGPILYLLLAVLFSRLLRLPRKAVLVASSAILLLATVQFTCARWALSHSWRAYAGRRLAENPQWIMLRSCWAELFHSNSFPTDGFPLEFLNEFKPHQQDPIAGATGLDPHRRPTHVIILILESVGNQFLELYGGPYPNTPRLQQESDNCLILDNFYTPAVKTANALFGITLSTYPAPGWRQSTSEWPDFPGITLANVLKSRGYRTAFITSAGLSIWRQDEFLRSGRGFDLIWEFRDFEQSDKLFSWGCRDSAMIDRLLKWIDEDRSRPFMSTLWTAQTHHPYALSGALPPIDYLGIGITDSADHQPCLNRFLNCIRETDWQIGRLIDELRRRQIADDTLVIIIGDHGEAFGMPHGAVFHGGELYQEAVNVPCIFWNPRLFHPGSRSKAPAGHIDLNPTILSILGIPGPLWQGHSILDPARPPRAYFFTLEGEEKLGLCENQWKFIYNRATDIHELFDLSADPQELHNLAPLRADMCQVFRQRLLAWVSFQHQHVARLTSRLR